MVYCWLVDVQEYDLTLEDILGVDNPVADGFSRLVANSMTPEIIASLLSPEPIPDYLKLEKYMTVFPDIMALNVRYVC
jgi:hypothetical protein